MHRWFVAAAIVIVVGGVGIGGNRVEARGAGDSDAGSPKTTRLLDEREVERVVALKEFATATHGEYSVSVGQPPRREHDKLLTDAWVYDAEDRSFRHWICFLRMQG